MSRRTDAAAARAAEMASEAARVLQARQQENKAERTEEKAAPQTDPDKRLSVSAKDEKVEAAKQANPRFGAMADIRKRRGEEEEPEVEKENPADTPKEPPAKAEAPAPENPQADATTSASDTPSAPVEEAPKTVKVKVDGEEFDAPAEEVEAAGGLRPYRMQRAAENRLKKANDALAETRKAQSEMTQLATALLQQKGGGPAKEPSDPEFLASKMNTIRFGTEEEGAAALLEAVRRLAKPVDQNAIVAQATARFAHDQAVANFDKEFQDVATNPIRLKAAVALRQEMIERHRIEKPNQPIDWNSFYRTIGTQVRGAFGGQSQAAGAPAATGGTPSPSSEKEARKASITTIPTAAARAQLPAEDKELSPEEERRRSIAEMKKRRGQG